MFKEFIIISAKIKKTWTKSYYKDFMDYLGQSITLYLLLFIYYLLSLILSINIRGTVPKQNKVNVGVPIARYEMYYLMNLILSCE